MFCLFQFTNVYVPGPNLVHSQQNANAPFWNEVSSAKNVQEVILKTEQGSLMDFDDCRKLIQKGLALGMLARLHLHILVTDRCSSPDHPLLKQILNSGHTKADELCLVTDMCEADLLAELA